MSETTAHRRAMARHMQDKTLARIVNRAIERRYGNGSSTKWKKILHAVGYGASLSSILKGRIQ